MPKTQPLCTGAESNLRDRGLGEVGKNSFIVLPGKGGHLMPLKTVCPNPGGFGEEFYSSGSRAACAQGLHVFNLASGGLLMGSQVIKL